MSHMSYIARKSCGCYVAALVISTDNMERFRDDAKEVLKWMRDGLTVEPVTVEFVRANLKGCQCGKTEKPPAATQEALL